MSMTYEEVVQYLGMDEPGAAAAERLDSEAVPHLKRIIHEGHPQLSVKAALALSVAGAEGHRDLVRELSLDPRPIMRVAAARATATLPAGRREGLLLRLLDDQDAGVQKAAIRASASEPTSAVVDRLRTGVWVDGSLAGLAGEVVERAGGGQ